MYDKQCRELIKNVVKFMLAEKENLGPVIPVQCYRRRAAEALKIAENTIKNVIKENLGEKEAPQNTRPKKKKKTEDVCNSVKMDVRQTIYQMIKENTYVTIKGLKQVLEDKRIYQGSWSSLRRLLLSIGFHYKRDCNRRALCEKPQIVSKRLNFLRKYKEYKAMNLYDFVFLDETWIFAKGGNRHSWQDDSIKSCRSANVGSGKRYIILHAGGRNGFVENASLIFSSKAKSDDYHDNMSAEVFEKWLLEKLLPSLENPTIIVLDNASYHSRVEERQPSTSWKKDEIKTWLEEKKIVHPQNAFKQELLAIAKSNKQNVNYKVDKLVEEHGHKVLRLPPYHCHYNPIEHVWALSKTFYDKHIGKVDYTDESILQTWQRALNQVTPEVWSNTVNHCDKLIEEDIKKKFVLTRCKKKLSLT
nr:PREDICTED: uncharacterized protein LOC103314336 [Tribolium castaneum]|eukprot:XP_015840131.1 PREDICTED: uncharacterized protein LOC103314336 [Tribolium castaneum]